MQSKYSRRNFLSSIAILSAGTAFESPLNFFSLFDGEAKDLKKKWGFFWKKSGGQKCSGFEALQQQHHVSTKGHFYRNGEIILFSRENIIALPIWIFWKQSDSKPADVVIALFENNDQLKKLGCLNRFEIEALYHLSANDYDRELLSAYCNNLKKSVDNSATSLLKSKISVTKNFYTHEVSYFKDKQLVSSRKFIHHS